MPEEFYRIKRLPPYVFAEVNALKAQARAAGRDVIDLGMGNPDGPTPPHIVAKLVECVQNPKTHGYSTSRGIAGLRRAYAAYYARRFNVELDPEREVIVTLGLEGGAGQSGAGDHRAGRHDPGAEPVLSDPRLRLHHGRRGGAPRADRPGARFPRRAEKGGAAHACRRRSRSCSISRPTRRRRPSISISTARSSISAAITTSSCCRTWPMPRSISTASRRPRSSKCRGRATSRSSSPR